MSRRFLDTIDKHLGPAVCCAVAFAAGQILAGHEVHKHYEALRLSERKVSTLPREQREDTFVKTVVPSLGLSNKKESYAAVRRLCVNGIYSSTGLGTDNELYVLDTCGWKLEQPYYGPDLPTPYPE